MKTKLNLLIVALFAIGSIALTSCKDKKESEPEQPTEQAKDYSKAENWLIKPDQAKFDIDIFVIYPTIAMQGTEPCVELTDDEKIQAAQFFTQGPACMADSANVYEPYYRQVTIEYATNNSTSAENYVQILRSNIGKKDIFAALDYYFANYNNGRPFLICSHSQGTAMTRIILDEYMPQHPEYMERMIAVYALGFSLPKTWMAANGLKGATRADDYGVIIGYNTEGPAATLTNQLVTSDDYAINPLTWSTTSDYAGIDQNLGSFEWIDETQNQYHIVSGIADAQIDASRVALICTTVTDYIAFPGDPFGDKSLHVYDWQAYYSNLGENGKARIRAYKAAHSK